MGEVAYILAENQAICTFAAHVHAVNGTETLSPIIDVYQCPTRQRDNILNAICSIYYIPTSRWYDL
tara:strand:- start:174 stop:371 length:198 start_codon:yes stop_codon:yes gene_type:complete